LLPVSLLRISELVVLISQIGAKRDGQEFDYATWLLKAWELPREQFRHEEVVRETEPWEIIYFKLYKSQIPVIEQALETAALMLGSTRSEIGRLVTSMTMRTPESELNGRPSLL
jgi:hypothetical protein